jgi:hypothetical protein
MIDIRAKTNLLFVPIFALPPPEDLPLSQCPFWPCGFPGPGGLPQQAGRPRLEGLDGGAKKGRNAHTALGILRNLRNYLTCDLAAEFNAGFAAR